MTGRTVKTIGWRKNYDGTEEMHVGYTQIPQDHPIWHIILDVYHYVKEGYGDNLAADLETQADRLRTEFPDRYKFVPAEEPPVVIMDLGVSVSNDNTEDKE